jgi:hypothetical protein
VVGKRRFPDRRAFDFQSLLFIEHGRLDSLQIANIRLASVMRDLCTPPNLIIKISIFHIVKIFSLIWPTWHGSCYIPDMSNNTLMTQTPKPVITIETKGELQC